MENYQKINTICLFILTTIAIAGVLSLTKSIMIPFTLSIFITLIYSPLIEYYQEKLKLPKSVVLSVSIAISMGILALIIFLVTNSIDSFVQGANQYKEKLDFMMIEGSKVLNQFGISLSEESALNMAKKIPVSKMLQGLTGGMVATLSNVFLIVVFTLFLITSESASERKSKTFEEIKRKTAKYIQAKLLTSGATALISYIVLLSFKVEMAFMFGVLTFMLNFIPNVGSIFAVGITIPVIILQFGFGGSLLAILILLAVTQIVIGNVIEPKIMGDSMGLHPVTILLMLTFWGFIWGVPGMFLSVPITATLKIVLAKFELTQPVADLFSGKFIKSI